MSEVIVKLNSDHIKVKGGQYVQDLVRCKDCKFRPIKEDAYGADHGFNIIAPNELEYCPCLIEDGWYSWMPDDNFYCGFGEREGE